MEGKCLSIGHLCHMLAMEYAHFAKQSGLQEYHFSENVLKMYYSNECRTEKLIRIFCKFLGGKGGEDINFFRGPHLSKG